MNLNRLLFSILGICMLVFPFIVNASSFIPRTIDSTLLESDIVVSGVISHIEFVQDDKSGNVFTEATIDSVNVLTNRGFEDTSRSFVIRYIGGFFTTTDLNGNRVKMDTSISGVPTLSIDDNIIAFLRNNGEFAVPYTFGTDSILLIGSAGLSISNGDGQVLERISENGHLIKKSIQNIAAQNSDVEILSYVGVQPVASTTVASEIHREPDLLTFETIEDYLVNRLNRPEYSGLENNFERNLNVQIRPMTRVQ